MLPESATKISPGRIFEATVWVSWNSRRSVKTETRFESPRSEFQHAGQLWYCPARLRQVRLCQPDFKAAWSITRIRKLRKRGRAIASSGINHETQEIMAPDVFGCGGTAGVVIIPRSVTDPGCHAR